MTGFVPAECHLWMVTDRRTAESHGEKVTDSVSRAVEAGIDAVLVRAKQLTRAGFADFAGSLQEAVGDRVPLIASHRGEVAAELGLAGVQYGTADGDPGELAANAPAGLEVGFSTHSVEEAVERAQQGYSWVFLGPVFATPRKLKYGDPLGLPAVRRAVKEVSIPVVCIGGVNGENAGRLAEAGATRAAAIRALHGPDSPDQIRALRGALYERDNGS